MLDNKGFIIIGDVILVLIGILFWFSESFAHAVGVVGFFPRFFAGLIALIIAGVLTAIATR
ncbi:hypothetical protein HYV50_04810 [Candidatus Pacearchaeota archaeon]|nr:hypothetical protein [Candidatus Pacearchaeota archaeon]